MADDSATDRSTSRARSTGSRRYGFYNLTAEGRGVLEQHKETWQKFVRAIASITEVKHA